MFFKRIEDLRIDHDKTQQELADMLRCNRQVYARYERGLREIPASMLIVLAKYYNVSVDYILGLTDDRNECCNKYKKTNLINSIVKIE